jgi:hypothetical protein
VAERYTRQAQTLLAYGPCGFDSHLPYSGQVCWENLKGHIVMACRAAAPVPPGWLAVPPVAPRERSRAVVIDRRAGLVGGLWRGLGLARGADPGGSVAIGRGACPGAALGWLRIDRRQSWLPLW